MQRQTNSPAKSLARNKRGFTKVSTLVSLLVTIAVLSLVALNRQSILDSISLRGYTPPANIAALAHDTTMNGYGQKIFYVNKPSLDNKTVFKTKCPNNGGEQSIILGCYHGNQNGIFLLDVTDSRLSGVEEVTAAHEMLHGAYDRLRSSERTRVDAMLQGYYDNGLKDTRIKATVDAYKKTEPNDVVNEMHSIFATEVDTLPPELEAYYQKYFVNRKAVVAFARKYQSEFSSRQAAVNRYDAELVSIKDTITTSEASLKTQQTEIDQTQAALQRQRAAGQIDSYNAGVPNYNALVNEYNRDVQTVRSLISDYNRVVAERNAIAVEESELARALDTNVQTIK